MLKSVFLNPLITLSSGVFLFFLFLLHVIIPNKFQKRFYGPPYYPIIGCLISFYQNRHRLLEWYTDLLAMSPTQTITVARYGARRTIVTANPENVEYILKTNFSNFPKGKPFTDILGDFLGNGIFNVDGDLWYSQRKLASHQFSARSLQEYVLRVLHDEIDKKLLPILELTSSNPLKTVDFQDLLRKVGFNIICKFSLGFDPRCLSLHVSPLMEAFDLASEICAKRGSATVSATWKMKKFIGVGSEKKLKEAINLIHSFVMKVIHERKKSLEVQQLNSHVNGEDILSKMILAGEDETVIRDMVISFIMAGKDTTSAAMTWLFYLLSVHPDIEYKVVNEIESRPSDVMKEMRFLKACLCESMRLYPPVAWDSKHAVVDDLLPDGTVIRRGDRVTYFPYGMGRMESIWGKDRFEFRPDRWFLQSDPNQDIKGYAYKFPVFQAGPRVCLGKELAFIQMKYVMATILKRFKISPVSLEAPKFVPFLTAHMAGGFKVYVHRRPNI